MTRCEIKELFYISFIFIINGERLNVRYIYIKKGTIVAKMITVRWVLILPSSIIIISIFGFLHKVISENSMLETNRDVDCKTCNINSTGE